MKRLLLILILLPSMLFAQHGIWRELGPTHLPENAQMRPETFTRIKGTGRLAFVEFDKRLPNRIFTGSPSGGLFVSDDRGASWRNGGTDFFWVPGVSHIQVAPESSSTWFIANGDGDADFSFSLGVARTRDEGQTWEWINGVEESLPFTDLNKPWKIVRIRKLLIDPRDGNRLWAATTEGLFLTTNALANPDQIRWKKVAPGVFYDLCFQPASMGRVLLASGDGLWRSGDGGFQFEQVTIPEDFGFQKDNLPVKQLTIRISSAAPSRLWVAYTANEGHSSRKFNAELYSMDLDSEQWSFVRTFGKDLGVQKRLGHGRSQAFAVHPNNPDELYWGNVLTVYKTEDGGQNVAAVTKDYHDDLHWISFDPHRQELYIATDGGINRSVDGGQSWEDLTHGIGVANMYNVGSSMTHPGHLSYGGFDTGNVWRDPLGIWRQVFFGDGFKSIPVVNDSSIYIYCSSSSGFGVTDPNGKTSFLTPNRRIGGGQWKKHYSIDPRQPELVYYAAQKGLIRSWNRGTEWEMVWPVPEGGEGWEAYLNRYNTNELYFTSISGVKGIWKTNDIRNEQTKEMKWVELHPWLSAYEGGEEIKMTVTDVEPDPFQPGACWISFGKLESGFKAYPHPKIIYFNGSGYEDWTGLFEGDPSLKNRKVTEVEADPGHAGRIYVGTSSGVFVKEGRGGNWKEEPGIPYAEVNELELHPYARVLRAATFGRGLWEMDLPQVSEEVKVRGDQQWTSRSIYTNLVVKKGSVLTLKGKTWIAKEVQIRVEPGAKVIVQGELFRSEDSDWRGFEVESSKGFLFFKGKTGEVEGRSVIER